MSDFDLSGYKPESPTDGAGFEPFKYDGACRVNKSIISVNDGLDTDWYPAGCNMIDIEVEVLEGEFAKRKLWKRYNLDSTKVSEKAKKPKTPVQKLADQLFPLGLEFSNLNELRAVNEKFATMTITVKAWGSKFPGDTEKKQQWNIKGVSNGAPTEKKESQVAF